MSVDESRLGARFWWWLALASLVRSPVLMSAVAFASVAALALGDPDRGGVLAGAGVVGLLLGTPLALAAQRRWSARSLLTAQLVGCAVCWLAFSIAVTAKAGMSVWIPCAVAAGMTMAGSAGLVRSMMAEAVVASHQARASTMDALAQDAIIFLAPVAVSLGVAVGAVGAPLSVVVVSVLAVIAVQARRPGSGRRPVSQGAAAQGVASKGPAPIAALSKSAASNGGVSTGADGPESSVSGRPWRKWLTWSFLSLGVGMVLGAVEAGAVGLAVGLGFSVGSAWLVFLVLAGSSAVGAWFDISVVQRRWPGHRLLGLLVTMALGCILIALGPSRPTAMAGLALVGLPTAALLGLRSHVFDGDADADRSGGLTLAFAAQSIGFAVGATMLAITGQAGALLISMALLVASGVVVLMSTNSAPDLRIRK